MRGLVLGAALLAGCTGSRLVDPGGESGGEAAPSSTTEVGGEHSAGGTSEGSSSSGETTDGDESSSGFDDPTAFLQDPDHGHVSLECSVWDQNCPAGQKCMPYSHNGDPTWNGTRCSPIADDPGDAGDSCTVEGSGVSGIDDCDLGLVCFHVDLDTNIGRCQPLCIGSEAEPLCEDPTQTCSITGDGILNLCLDACVPLAADCPGDQGCYPFVDSFTCVYDVSGDEGAYGDPCQAINTCDPGLACVSAEAVPGCGGGVGCCTPYCDTTAPNTCPGEGQECVPWFDPADAPAGLTNTGICSLPPR